MKRNLPILLSIFIVCFLLVNLRLKAEMPSPLTDEINGTRLVLMGKAVKKFLTFRVVSVDLFVASGYNSDQIFNDIPKRLQVVYHVNIPKAELDRATLKGIQKNVSPEELKILMPKIEQINSYYPNVESDDRIVITYIPGLGSEVRVNGNVKGIVSGKDFANAFFAIWVGENPVDEKAKLQLLGKKTRSVKQDGIEN